MTSPNANKFNIVRNELKLLLELADHRSATESVSTGEFSLDDDITVTYLAGIAEDLCASCYDLDDFDLEAFVETICAYVPPLSVLDSCQLKEWIVEVARKLASQTSLGVAPAVSDSVSFVKIPSFSSSQLPTFDPVCPATSQQIAEDAASAAAGDHGDDEDDPDAMDDRVALLLEMFGGMCSLAAVQKSLHRAGGNVDKAVQELLDCGNDDDVGSAESSEGYCVASSPSSSSAAAAAVHATNLVTTKARQDQALRASILSRYGYVASDDGRDSTSRQCPKPIVSEEKKLIRYRDGQVVSTKGERYMEVKKQETEEMKKTYISLKPLKKYRWH